MNLRAKATLAAVLFAAPLASTTQAWASSGGAGSSPGGASLPGAAPTVPSGGVGAGIPGVPAQNGDLVTSATSDGITVTATASALLGGHLAFTGTTTGSSAGDTVVLQRLDPTAGWVGVASGTVVPGGAFSIRWRTNHAGRLTVRAVLVRGATSSQAGQTPPVLQLTIYRPAIATIYGKGFFGQQTACGHTLRRTTLGVANRTLKCGTPVQIFYRGRVIVVPVIDRGPYANHASWDLTQATANALGITGTETIGTVAG